VVVLGPLFGAGMIPATGEAGERELATLLDAGLSLAQVQQLHGARRALRVQPAKAMVDLDGQDLVVQCELPEEAAITTLLDELIKPQAQGEA
jgi:tRNA(Glu) U13 pseudouridine synthase TruD